MSAKIREWRNEEWCHTEQGRDQAELVRMMKDIMRNADEVENEPTPGHSREDLSRCIVCVSSLIPNTKYVIHVSGFTVEDITEIVFL